jgi:hypothetical protein
MDRQHHRRTPLRSVLMHRRDGDRCARLHLLETISHEGISPLRALLLSELCEELAY